MVGPQFRTIKEAELLGTVQNQNPVALFFSKGSVSGSGAASASSSSQRSTLSFDYATPVPRFYEEMAGHWGVETSLSAPCPYCSLPLTGRQQEKEDPILLLLPQSHFHYHPLNSSSFSFPPSKSTLNILSSTCPRKHRHQHQCFSLWPRFS
jgi:hypothetical protein